VFPSPAAGGGLEELVVACVRAAVLAPEKDVTRWFSWKPKPDTVLVDRLVGEGRLARPAPGWISVP
jgi:hypothetical protein